MGRTFNQIKQSVLGKNFDVNSYSKTNKKGRTFDEIKNKVMSGNADFSLVKAELENRIGINTFETDLSSMSKILMETSNGWQTPETMKNTRLSVESMQSRLSAYKDYQRLFGNKDTKSIEDLQHAMRTSLDNWDNLSNDYAKYKNADAYNAEKDALKSLYSMSSKDIQTKMDSINDIYNTANILKNKASGLQFQANKDKINVGANPKTSITSILGLEQPDNKTTIQNIMGLDTAETKAITPDDIITAENEYKEYLKSVGYKSLEDIENAKKGVAYTTADGQNITWKSLYDTKKHKEDTEALYKEISSREDFEKYKNEGANIENPTYKEAEKGVSIFGWKPFAEDVENPVEYSIDNAAYIGANDMFSPGGNSNGNILYTHTTMQERELYNYYLGRERAGLEKEGTADEYLKSITGILKDRHENKVISGLVEYTDEHPVLASGISVGQNLLAGAEYIKDSIDYIRTGELDTNHLSKASSTVRNTVSQKVDWEIGNWDAFDFLYNTTMSGIDSAVAMTTFGGTGGVVLGLSAAAQGTNDALERGLDNKSAFWNGFSAGVFEGLFETYSIGKFKAFKEAPVDGVKSIIKNIGKSMLTNASEETLTELANITYDYFANGDLSQAKTDIRAYMSAGMSEKDAIKKVALEQGARVVEAGASGALMGIGFGGISGVAAYSNSKSIGKDIKSNERVHALFDLASNPETASAYEAYTEYANKGITSDNISDAQLGRLYTEAKTGAVETIQSKKTTREQKAKALSTLANLSEFDSANEFAKKVREDHNIGEKTEVTYNGEAVDIKNAKIKNGDLVVETKEGEASVDDLTLTQSDAELATKAQGIAKTDGDDVANLFLSQYDGKTDVDDYARSFGLMSMYANHIESFTEEHILENKGALSTDTAKAIYNGLIVANSKIKKANASIKANAENVERGTINESIFNYGKDYVPGKVNWNNLADREKMAVVFAKGLYKKLGSNLSFLYKETEFNGMYDVGKDMTYVDVYAGKSTANWTGKDFIISTIAHELTHEMEVKSPETFKQLAELVLSSLEKSPDFKGKTRNDIIAEEIERLKKKGRNHTDADAISEIVARSCEDLLAESKEAKAMFKSLSPAEQKTLVEKIKDLIQKVVNWIDEFLSTYKNQSKSAEAKALRKMKETFAEMLTLWDSMLLDVQKYNQEVANSKADESIKNDLDGEITSIGSRDLTELSEAVDEDGKQLFQYRAMEEDKEVYRDMLLKHKEAIGINENDIDALFTTIDKAIDIISENVEALDYAWDADIDDRAFHPIKPNSDKLYKVSLDFSTLCRKRLLQQTIQTTLQEALNKNLSKEESIAIRDELMKIQEEGRKIEIACALCYVESARMKSPVQINKFLNNKESILREFFANKDASTKEKVEKAEMKAREILAKKNPKGFKGKNNVELDALTASKSAMYKKDADFIRDAGKKVKAEYKLTEEEQKKLDAALKMKAVDFTSAEGLENLAKNHADIFDAYTSFVRNATHSKGLESDVWWRAGDSDAIGDTLIAQMNEENGLRSQSWSDFQVIHLLDYIAATIELSAKKAKRQSYTKVPDYVKLLGNTGDMINMSVIPERAFNGKLGYDDVEGMAYKVATELREEFHKTAGIICIGVKNEQISMLLEDLNIDMVIPYHSSSMSKVVRKLMHIPEWDDYQKYQNETKLSDAEAQARADEYGVELKKDDKNYQKSPNFSDWFDLAEARQIAEYENKNPSNKDAKKKYGVMYGGYMAMQNAANTYLKLCAERGLAPKFSHEKADFTQDANYWKLLIDRKMVDNVTGEIIEQQAIKPIFKEDSVLEILNDELARYPEVKADQEYAQRKVTEKFLSGDMKMDKSTREAIKKPIDNVTKVNILESAKARLNDMGIKYLEYESGNEDARLKALNSLENLRFSDRETEYLELAKDPVKNEAKLREMVKNVAEKAGAITDDNGEPLKLYRGTEGGKTSFPVSKGHKGIIYTIDNVNMASNYGNKSGKAVEISKQQKGIPTTYALYCFADNVLSIDAQYGVAYDLIVPEELLKYSEGRYKATETEIAEWAKEEGYDAVRVKNVRLVGVQVGEEVLVLKDKLLKSADTVTYDDNGNVIPLSERFNTENEDIRYSDRDYSYENLVSKPDMKLTILDGSVPNNRADIIAQAKKNAAEVGKINPQDKTVSVYVDDIGREIVIGTDGLQHGMARGKNIQNRPIGIVTLKAGEIIKNSIRINELNPSKATATGSYILIGASVDTNGNLYLVRSVVNEYGNKLASMDVLYAINTKKESAMLNASRYAKKSLSVTDSTISIAELLDYVNKYFPDILPESVLRHYGYDARPESKADDKLGESVLYSDRDDTTVYDLMGERDRLLKENERFKADIERLKERLKIEKQVTKGNYFNENQLDAVAGHLRNISNSTYDKAELIKGLKDVYSFIAHTEQFTWEDVYERTYKLAEKMLAEAKPQKVIDDYSKMILRDIRGKKIAFSESQKNEAQYIFGKNWNRNFFGRANITDGGVSLDSQWQEWSTMYPNIFDANISDSNMVGELYDIINSLTEASETIMEYNVEEQTRWLANEIYNQYWNVSPVRTTADKYDKQIKLLNFEHRRAMKESRDAYESRLAEQKKVSKENHQKLVKELRERKDKEIARAKELGKQRLDKFKENAERKTRIQSITANALTLKKWLTKNSKDYHIHEAMKGPVTKLLTALDFSSKQMLEEGLPTTRDITFMEAFAEIKTMLQNADNMVEGLEELYGHDLAEQIDLLTKATYRLIGDNNYVINAMTVEELQSLDKLIRHIKKTVTELNKFHVINHNQGAVNLANEFMVYGNKLGNLEKQHGKLSKFFEFRNRTPYYFFKDLGDVGQKLFRAFQDGWDKLAFNAKKVIDFANETYTSEEVKKWSNETKEFKIAQLDGSDRTFKMSIAQIMALYAVSKQEDAQRHLLSGGMTLKRIDKKGHVVADYENITLTITDIQSILSTLDKRQREVADKLQGFMNTVCAAWGNEISMARFGIEQFGIPNYFPIKVSEATVPTDNTKDVDNASLFRLLNMSFTKARNLNAEQSVEIGDIFDIFAQHSSDMAKYNALALPVLDFNKFYSIQGKDFNNKEYGVVKTLKAVFGDEADSYLRRFVRDLNGSQNVSRDVIGNTFFKNAKLASVAANLRVVLLQPTAYHKAGAVIDNKYLLKASAYIKVEPIGMVRKLKKAIADAEKYCGIVQWKALGYYDTDISKGITEKIKHADTVKDKVAEAAMKGAEIADKVTFGTLWIACDFEIRDTRKDLKVGSPEFFGAVAERLRDVIYATQVVDSTMTRSDMMRSTDGRDKMLTTFGSEPIIAYNMLLDMVTQINRDIPKFGKKETFKRNAKKIRKVVTAYIITNIMAALVESGFDVLRDDDDEEMDAIELLKLYFKNFAMDMSIGNKLPYFKDAYSILQGYSSSRIDTQWVQSINYMAKDVKKVVEGEGDVSKLIKDTLKFMSYVSGLPAYNAYRDLMAIVDKLGILDD